MRRALEAEEGQLQGMREELGLNELGAVVNQRFVGDVLSVAGRELRSGKAIRDTQGFIG